MIRTLVIDGDFSALRDLLAQRSETMASTAGNHQGGGWTCALDALPPKHVAGFIAQLTKRVALELGGLARLHAWGVVHRNGSHHTWHEHGGGQWSGVYYLTSSEAATVFLIDGVEHRVLPRPGTAILFPTNLWHRTEPQPGTIPRVTVAFNARSP